MTEKAPCAVVPLAKRDLRSGRIVVASFFRRRDDAESPFLLLQQAVDFVNQFHQLLGVLFFGGQSAQFKPAFLCSGVQSLTSSRGAKIMRDEIRKVKTRVVLRFELAVAYIAAITERKFEDVQRELDETLWNLKRTNDPEFRRALLKKMLHLTDEAQRIADSPSELLKLPRTNANAVTPQNTPILRKHRPLV
jgi:hypothetical protein